MAVPERVKTQMKKHGLSGVNKPKKTPQHPKKSHIVMASWSEGGGTKYRLIRFGEQGAKTAGKPKAGEGRKMTMKRKKFKSRHQRHIKLGKKSAAYWSDVVKW